MTQVLGPLAVPGAAEVGAVLTLSVAWLAISTRTFWALHSGAAHTAARAESSAGKRRMKASLTNFCAQRREKPALIGESGGAAYC